MVPSQKQSNASSEEIFLDEGGLTFFFAQKIKKIIFRFLVMKPKKR